MVCTRCVATTKGGNQCKNRTCKQYPYCWVHLKAKDKLQVKKSTIEGAGEGLFYVGKKDLTPNKKVTPTKSPHSQSPTAPSTAAASTARCGRGQQQQKKMKKITRRAQQ